MKQYILLLAFLLCKLLAAAENNDKALWQLSTSDYNSTYIGTPMANGGIGIMPWKEPFSVRHVILNHVFDNDNQVTGVTRVLKGINPFLLDVTLNGEKIAANNIKNWKQVIDMQEATHTTSFIVPNKAEVSYSICALRNMPYCGLINIRIKALAPLSIQASNRMEVPEDDYSSSVTRFRTQYDGVIRMDVLQTTGSSLFNKQSVSASSSFITEDKNLLPTYDETKKEASIRKEIKKDETFTFSLVGSICSTRDFIDPRNESERQAIHAAQEGTPRLMAAHSRLWEELWEGNIFIEGDDEAQRNIRFALFNLYSFCREGSRLSVSPMGLSSQGYNGHIFWDTEVWMFPPMLLLNQGIAKSMMDYRTDRLRSAEMKAMAYGYKGAMFPWESDDSGQEATPTFALCGSFEHHITADIALACWNYYNVTHDKQWLMNQGYPLMKATADFWVSRCELNSDNSHSIRNVVGANEYAIGIDDNAFTNASVSKSLDATCKAALICGDIPSLDWIKVKGHIRIPSFPNGTTREHERYNGEMIKQADANLLGYPLEMITDRKILRQDLDYYAEKIDPKNGPAMSFAIFCVQYARLGDADKAYEAFRKCYQPNLRKPFGVLAETATSNNPYFATGAGGLLQAVINGFCGLRISENGIEQIHSVLPKHWKRLTVTGVGMDKKTYIRENSHK